MLSHGEEDEYYGDDFEDDFVDSDSAASDPPRATAEPAPVPAPPSVIAVPDELTAPRPSVAEPGTARSSGASEMATEPEGGRGVDNTETAPSEPMPASAAPLPAQLMALSVLTSSEKNAPELAAAVTNSPAVQAAAATPPSVCSIVGSSAPLPPPTQTSMRVPVTAANGPSALIVAPVVPAPSPTPVVPRSQYPPIKAFADQQHSADPVDFDGNTDCRESVAAPATAAPERAAVPAPVPAVADPPPTARASRRQLESKPELAPEHAARALAARIFALSHHASTQSGLVLLNQAQLSAAIGRLRSEITIAVAHADSMRVFSQFDAHVAARLKIERSQEQSEQQPGGQRAQADEREGVYSQRFVSLLSSAASSAPCDEFVAAALDDGAETSATEAIAHCLLHALHQLATNVPSRTSEHDQHGHERWWHVRPATSAMQSDSEVETLAPERAQARHAAAGATHDTAGARLVSQTLALDAGGRRATRALLVALHGSAIQPNALAALAAATRFASQRANSLEAVLALVGPARQFWMFAEQRKWRAQEIFSGVMIEARRRENAGNGADGIVTDSSTSTINESALCAALSRWLALSHGEARNSSSVPGTASSRRLSPTPTSPRNVAPSSSMAKAKDPAIRAFVDRVFGDETSLDFDKLGRSLKTIRRECADTRRRSHGAQVLRRLEKTALADFDTLSLWFECAVEQYGGARARAALGGPDASTAARLSTHELRNAMRELASSHGQNGNSVTDEHVMSLISYVRMTIVAVAAQQPLGRAKAGAAGIAGGAGARDAEPAAPEAAACPRGTISAAELTRAAAVARNEPNVNDPVLMCCSGVDAYMQRHRWRVADLAGHVALVNGSGNDRDGDDAHVGYAEFGRALEEWKVMEAAATAAVQSRSSARSGDRDLRSTGGSSIHQSVSAGSASLSGLVMGFNVSKGMSPRELKTAARKQFHTDVTTRVSERDEHLFGVICEADEPRELLEAVELQRMDGTQWGGDANSPGKRGAVLYDLNGRRPASPDTAGQGQVERGTTTIGKEVSDCFRDAMSNAVSSTHDTQTQLALAMQKGQVTPAEKIKMMRKRFDKDIRNVIERIDNTVIAEVEHRLNLAAEAEPTLTSDADVDARMRALVDNQLEANHSGPGSCRKKKRPASARRSRCKKPQAGFEAMSAEWVSARVDTGTETGVGAESAAILVGPPPRPPQKRAQKKRPASAPGRRVNASATTPRHGGHNDSSSSPGCGLHLRGDDTPASKQRPQLLDQNETPHYIADLITPQSMPYGSRGRELWTTNVY